MSDAITFSCPYIFQSPWVNSAPSCPPAPISKILVLFMFKRMRREVIKKEIRAHTVQTISRLSRKKLLLLGMNPLRLTAIIEKEGDGYVSICPELDIASQGNTVEEAESNVKEAIELFLEHATQKEVDKRYKI